MPPSRQMPVPCRLKAGLIITFPCFVLLYSLTLCESKMQSETLFPVDSPPAVCVSLRRLFIEPFQARTQMPSYEIPRRIMPLADGTKFADVAEASRLADGHVPGFVGNYLSYPDPDKCLPTIQLQPLNVYILRRDIHRAHAMLKLPGLDVTNVSCNDGHTDHSHLSGNAHAPRVRCWVSYSTPGKISLVDGDPHPAVQAYRHSPFFHDYPHAATDVFRDVSEPGVGHPRVIYDGPKKIHPLAAMRCKHYAR